MNSVKPVSLEDHLQVVEAARERAEALPAAEVAEPDMPVRVFIDEAETAVTAALEHLADLEKVGLLREMVDALARDVKALDSAQRLWNTERRGGRSEAVGGLIETCEDYRQDLLDASDLALRKEAKGKERLSLIREGEGLPDLIADLSDLAVLVTDYRPLYEAIHLDVDGSSNQAVALGKELKSALAEEKVGKSLST
jgi:hypothetical protein